MTVPTEETPGYTEDADTRYDDYIPPIPVFIAKSERVQAAHFGALAPFAIPFAGSNPPVQVLNRRPTRNQAILYNPLNTAAQAATVSNTQVSPAANTTISSVTTLTPGAWYRITCTIGISGTVGAPENTFARLAVGGTVLQIPIQGGTTLTTTYLIRSATASIFLTSTNQAATVGSIWQGTLSVVPANDVSTPVLLSTSPASLTGPNPVGYVLDSGQGIKIESQQPVWAILPAGSTVNGVLMAMDESWESEDGN